VREALMPRVVAPVDGDIAFEKKQLGGRARQMLPSTSSDAFLTLVS